MSLPRYPDYRDSGVDWLGAVPSDWEVARLKAKVSLVTEKAEHRTRPVALENVESWSGRFLPTGGEFEGDGVAFCKGDLLFGKLRPYLAKVYLADEPGEAVGDFHVIRVVRDLEPRFLQYQILNRSFIDVVDGTTFGSKMPRASWEALGGMPVVVPSIAEQRAIADFIDRETAKIDAHIAEQERLLNLLAEKRRAAISSGVTNGLRRGVKTKESGVKWIGSVPAHWTVMPIRFAARLESGHTPSRSREDWWRDCTVPWFTLADVWQIRQDGADVIFETKEKVSEVGLANSSARILPKGTVMLSRTASVGFSAIMGVDMATTQDFANWVCGKDLLPDFLLYVFRAMDSEFKRLMIGSTHSTIYMPDIQALRFALPPKEEQIEIVAHIRSVLRDIDAISNEARRAESLLRERRAALIAAAVTGQVDVRPCSR